VLAAARALSDGREIEWERLAATIPAFADRLRQLRVIQSIAQACAAPLPLAAADVGPDGAPERRDGAGPPARPDGGPEDRAGRDESRLDAPAGPSRWGALEIIEKVGAGGFGEVFRALDTVLHREVALKLRRLAGEAEAAAFQVHLEEARRLARVRHPNVLVVHGVEVHDGRAGMWTDFIHGETLEARLRREGPLTAEEIGRIGIDLGGALGAVHDAGLIHGDIKTANVMRETGGRTVLMDFGAGMRAQEDASGLGSSPQGTPIAMAPELLLGGRPSIASDLYALGVLLYRLATGRYPVMASSWTELLEKHRRGEILPVRELRPDLPFSLVRVIERCLSRDPAERPASARETTAFFRAIDALEERSAESASGAGAFAGRERPGRTGAGQETGAAVTRADGAVGVMDPGRSRAAAPSDHHAAETGAGAGAPATGSIGGPAPTFPTRLVGRREELRTLRRLLLEPGLVTLTGAGGCGKTRLAFRAAEEASGALRDGAWWVPLAGLADPALIAQTVARALGVPESKQRPAREELLDHVRERSLLLVLDNCEHLREAAGELAGALLRAAPRLRILATSREALGRPGEQTLRVPSLPVPPPAPGVAEGLEILDSEAVRLFVDRACRQSPGFAVTPQAAPAIARIVRRLDGIPLAIELAAARIGALAPEQIAERLDEGFRLLADRGAAVLPRQQTLRASIDWSYGLLEPEERKLLARASVFAGGWTLESAEAVCADPAPDAAEERLGAPAEPNRAAEPVPGPRPAPAGEIGGIPVLDLVDALVRRSMVQFEGSAKGGRYRLLEAVRDFAAERLRAFGEEAGCRDRHLDWALAFARRQDARIIGPEQTAANDSFEAEVGNFRAALAWAREDASGRGEGAGLLLCLALRRFWFQREYYREGARHLETQLARGAPFPEERTTEMTVLRGRSLVAAAGLVWPLGDLERAWRLAEDGLRELRAAGDVDWTAWALSTLGFLADLRGQAETARSCLGEALALHEARGKRDGMAVLSSNLGVLETRLGNHAAAVPHYERALGLIRDLGDEPNVAVTLRNLSYSLQQLGERSRARALAEEGISILRRVGQRRMLAASLSALADLLVAEGEPAEARRQALEALHLAREAGEKVTLLAVLTVLGVIALALRQEVRAARLLGAAEALHEALGVPLGEGERDDWAARVADLSAKLGPERFEALRAEGRALPLEAALAVAEGGEAEENARPAL